MKKLFFSLAVISGIAFANIGCKKETMSDTTTIHALAGDNGETVVTVTIPMNTQYQYDLGVFGREEYAEIVKQPAHYAISEVSRVENSHMIYTYMPAKEFSGTDEVVIQLNKDSDGTGPKSISYLRIIFNVVPAK